ncbi:MAG: STAS domain-containing protein [Clostridia bacterium]|nr:STAS domain-containing protein [Clostridia bacterium]
MRVNYVIENNSVYFYLIGELDEHYARGAKDYVDRILEDLKGYTKVIFNLNELTFMDSTGIGMLLGRYKKLKKIGVPMYIENPTVNVEKMLVLAGIYEVIKKI